MAENYIYSKIEYPNAISAKRSLLEAEMGLLKSLKSLEKYKNLRKKETLLKIRLKKVVSEVKDNVNTILKQVPKTSGVREIESDFREKQKKLKSKAKKGASFQLSVEDELADIQRQLQELG